jgi:hypothetical protein
MPQETLDPRLLVLDPRDNVAVVRRRIAAGTSVIVPGARLVATGDIGLGHKLAVRSIAPGETVLKYGAPIGRSTTAIAAGEHVHVHNMESAYTPTYTLDEARARHGEHA